MAIAVGGKSPTIQDVARHAGVSAATVSRAISAPDKVSEVTRARVESAIRETGYTVNQSARSLRLKAARTILIALPNIGNPFYSTILDAVVEEAGHAGYGVIVANRAGDHPGSWMRKYFLSGRADGMLLFDGAIDPLAVGVVPETGRSIPLVVAADEVPDANVHAVLTDNSAAAQRVVEHLVGLGHRRIGHIVSPTKNALPSDRLIGFRAAMQAADLEIRPEWLVQGDFTLAAGQAAARRFARMADRPTAVFAGNDEMAIGFIGELRRHGIDCPRDMSVIGFDDISVAGHIFPPLTTMRLPRREIGRRATRILISLIAGEAPRGVSRTILRSELVVRESTAAPALETEPRHSALSFRLR
jgi:LacI family repressor for deo operon, udp, cdd, tsx, nupC, and nupG